MKTPLYEWHVTHGAKMVDFAGWQMPIHYGSQLEEHQCVRNQAGLFDVSHMNVVDVTGKDAKEYLQKLCANNIEKLIPGKALYTCMLDNSAGIIDDLIVYYIAENNYRLVLNAGTREKDLNWLNKIISNFDVQIYPRDKMAIIALQGPEAVNIAKNRFEHNFPEKTFYFSFVDNIMIARTGYTGEDGVEIICPADQAEKIWNQFIHAGAKPIGLGARDSLRLEAGLNLYGSDMDESVTPLESNVSWTVAWEPADRNFIGREKLEEQKNAGIPQKLIGLMLETGGVLRHGQKVFSQGNEIGVITSGGFSPTLNVSIAMARIENKVFDEMAVEIRGKHLPVKLVPLPFIKKR
ncbi:MAG TPA: glycine cleavage system aminomethyltransferase GcvT [Gammaproteobacteria bacterium]|nr:glycine cleavage system aminomethyltransferase GcvT [Gammaproteobacteria bacterium]